ncbi:hypothetical protein [Moraxella bovis]|uniref:CopG family transcriptional regulator n=1 Tax=Moraxella bovis TaxID=476 RepID=A0A378PP06_MORBO|nr:hypothetical protein [Moraxella bovis]STY88566.1 Uncharacterised protein [Moraxella bovis]
MPNLTTAKSTKARTSIALDIEKKKAIEEIARQQNRTPHYVMLEMISKGIQEAQEEAQYQEYIKNRVMRAYNEMIENGSQGVSGAEAKEIVMHKVRERLANNK